MKFNMKRGFTLIELLVVIAIIGILSSIVLVSLNSARNKGKDTRIISDVNQTRTQLESNFSGSSYPDLISNKFSTAAGSSTVINTLAADATAEGGSLMVFTDAATATKYAVYSPLSSSASTYFCIDSAGKAEQTGTAPSTYTCP